MLNSKTVINSLSLWCNLYLNHLRGKRGKAASFPFKAGSKVIFDRLTKFQGSTGELCSTCTWNGCRLFRKTFKQQHKSGQMCPEEKHGKFHSPLDSAEFCSQSVTVFHHSKQMNASLVIGIPSSNASGERGEVELCWALSQHNNPPVLPHFPALVNRHYQHNIIVSSITRIRSGNKPPQAWINDN